MSETGQGGSGQDGPQQSDPAATLLAPSGAAIAGHVVTAIAALGASVVEDERVQAVLGIVTGEVTLTEKVANRGRLATHAVPGGGLDVRIAEGVLDQVTFRLTSSNRWQAFPDPAGIIDGLPLPAVTPGEVEELLGAPYRQAPAVMSRFHLGAAHVHIGWNAAGARVVVVLREA